MRNNWSAMSTCAGNQQQKFNLVRSSLWPKKTSRRVLARCGSCFSAMDDQECPRCKTTRYRNPSLKLMVNVCGHALCENCVELLFVRGSGIYLCIVSWRKLITTYVQIYDKVSILHFLFMVFKGFLLIKLFPWLKDFIIVGACPQCNVPLRRTNFRVQLFEDPTVEKEVDIRRKILKVGSMPFGFLYLIQQVSFCNYWKWYQTYHIDALIGAYYSKIDFETFTVSLH